MRSKCSARHYLLFILLGAFAVRLYRLGVASLWYDETVSLYLARQDLVELTRHTAGDIHPPLYYYILHFWGRLAGWSEFAAAFVSVFFGVLLVALAFRVAKEWFVAPVPLLAALLVAASPFNLWYSQEVRMYTLGAFLGLASVYLFARMLAGAHFTPRPLLAYTVVSALGLYTLYYFVFVLVFENLVALVWLARRSRHFADARSFDSAPHTTRGSAQADNHPFDLQLHAGAPQSLIPNLAERSGDPAPFAGQSPTPRGRFAVSLWPLSQLAIAVLYLPWAFVALHQAIDPPVPPWRSLTNPLVALGESFSVLTFGQSVDPVQVLPLLVIVAVLLAMAVMQARRFVHPRSVGISGGFLLAYTLVPIVVILLLSLWKPLYHVRYIYIYSVGFYLLLAVGMARLARVRLGRALAAGAAVLFLVGAGYSAYNFWFNPRYADDDLRGAVQRLSSLWRPGDAILIDAGYAYTAFDYYGAVPVAWQGRLTDYAPGNVVASAGMISLADSAVVLQTGSIGGAPNLGWGSPASDFYATTVEETRAALDRVFAAHPRVWLLRLYDTVVDPDGIIRDYLAQRGRIIDDQGFAGESFARVQGYLTSRAPMTALPATAIPRRILLGRRIALVGYEPGQAAARGGLPVDVNVYWEAEEPTNVDEHVFVGLYAEDGTLVASSDEVPLGNALGTSRWSKGEILREPIRLMVPPETRGGRYTLRLTMYNPLTEEPLAPDPGSGAVENHQIVLTSIEVIK